MAVLILTWAAVAFAVAGAVGAMWSVLCESYRGFGVSVIFLAAAFGLSLAALVTLGVTA